MPLPLILGIGAAIAGAAGVGSGIHGAVKMKEASDTMNSTKRRHEQNIEKFERENKTTSEKMDKLGKLELEILQSFSQFSDVFEQIKNRPIFEPYSKDGVTLPRYDGEKIKEVSVGAGVLLGGLGGAGLGAAGSFAATGATTAAVMALGTASTGTAIASLSGAAATNATLAALGGGAIAAGGGGMALGTAVLGATTLGVGIMVGGIIFNVVGGSLSDKADEAYHQVRKEEEEVNKICDFCLKLKKTAEKYRKTLSAVNEVYHKKLNILTYIVNTLHKQDWNDFSQEEKLVTENTALLVGLLYKMEKVELVLKSDNDTNTDTVNEEDDEEAISNVKPAAKKAGTKPKSGANANINTINKEAVEEAISEAKSVLYNLDEE